MHFTVKVSKGSSAIKKYGFLGVAVVLEEVCHYGGGSEISYMLEILPIVSDHFMLKSKGEWTWP